MNRLFCLQTPHLLAFYGSLAFTKRDMELLAVENYLQGPITLPGPTGESNRLSTFPRGVVLKPGRNEFIFTRVSGGDLHLEAIRFLR